jgi:hypothetical protein
MGEHSEIMSAPAKLARAGGKRTRALFCHRFIVRHNLKPRFMKVATFPEEMPEYNLKRTDRGWLVRLVGEVLMLLTDSYMTPPAGVERLRCGVTRPEYLEALAACGIPRSPFFPLNRALPLKQCVSDKSDTKECRNCKATKSRNWFFDFVLQVVLTTIFLCETRWVYAVYHGGQDRPKYLWRRKAPKSGPCDNCGIEETVRWHWHPLKKALKHCHPCYMFFQLRKFERPREIYRKESVVRICVDCDRTYSQVGGIWRPIRDELGKKRTGAYQCPACATRLDSLTLATAEKQGNYHCRGCNITDSSIEWHTVRCCDPCWKSLRKHDDLKSLRDRKEC